MNSPKIDPKLDAKPEKLFYHPVVGSVLVWLAFPPVGWSLLAWIGPVWWFRWIAKPQLPGRRPYRALWLAGFVFWMLAVHWIRLPHPMNYLALVVLAGYLGLYLPLMVGLSRVAVWQLRIPLWLAAPIVWTLSIWSHCIMLQDFWMWTISSKAFFEWPLARLESVEQLFPRVFQLLDFSRDGGDLLV